MIEKDEARSRLIELGEEGIVSWEEIARNCIAAMESERCLWILQVYGYDDYFESDDEDLEDYEYSDYLDDDDYYTMIDWERDGGLEVRLNQIITPDVYWELEGALPPTSNGLYFQPGEPLSHDANGVALYSTFKRVKYDEYGNPFYRYIGVHPEK